MDVSDRTSSTRQAFSPSVTAVAGWTCSLLVVATAVAFLGLLALRGWTDLAHSRAAAIGTTFAGELEMSTRVVAASIPIVVAIAFFAAVSTVSRAIGGHSWHWLNTSLRFGPAMPAVVLAAAAIGVIRFASGGQWFDDHPILGLVIALAAFNLPIMTERFRSALRSVPRRWRVAAIAAGASPAFAFARVALPRAWPGIGAVVLNGVGEMFGESVVVLSLLGVRYGTLPAAAALVKGLATRAPFTAGVETQVALLAALVVVFRIAAGAIYRRFGTV